MNNCGNCRFWMHEIRREGDYDIGRCHRYAPRAALGGQLDESADTWAFWPKTTSDQECGEGEQ